MGWRSRVGGMGQAQTQAPAHGSRLPTPHPHLRAQAGVCMGKAFLCPW